MLAARDEMLTTLPAPASTMCGTQSWVSVKAASTLNLNAASTLRGLVARTGRGSHPPALFTSTSIRPSFARGPFDQRLQLLGVGHVGRDRDRPAPAVADPAGDGVEVFLRARREHDVGPRFGERDGAARADALARAGDDGDAVGEVEPVLDHRGRVRPARDMRRDDDEGARIMTDEVLVAVDDGVATIMINRPEARTR